MKIYISHTQATKYYTASNVLREGTEVWGMWSMYQIQTMVSFFGILRRKKYKHSYIDCKALGRPYCETKENRTWHSLLTYSMQHSPSSEADWFSASQEIPRIIGTPRFITAFSSSYPEPDDSIPWPPHPTFWRSILILSSHLLLGLLSGLFPSCFSTKTLYTSLLSPTCAICPAHLILLDFITRIIFWWAVLIIKPLYAVFYPPLLPRSS